MYMYMFFTKSFLWCNTMMLLYNISSILLFSQIYHYKHNCLYTFIAYELYRVVLGTGGNCTIYVEFFFPILYAVCRAGTLIISTGEATLVL